MRALSLSGTLRVMMAILPRTVRVTLSPSEDMLAAGWMDVTDGLVVV